MTDAPITLRQAVAADEVAIVKLVERAFTRHIKVVGRRPAPMDKDYATPIAAAECTVAVLGSEIVGVLVWELRPNDFYLDVIAVAPEQQQRGIGRVLLSEADRLARKHRRSALRLCTNAAMTDNIAMYAALGWIQTAAGVENGYNRVFFEKQTPSGQQQSR